MKLVRSFTVISFLVKELAANPNGIEQNLADKTIDKLTETDMALALARPQTASMASSLLIPPRGVSAPTMQLRGSLRNPLPKFALAQPAAIRNPSMKSQLEGESPNQHSATEDAMVKIRFARFGRRHKPFYRVVAIDSRRAVTGRPIEYLGWYDPFSKEHKLDLQSVKKWIALGAQPSTTAAALIRRAVKGKSS